MLQFGWICVIMESCFTCWELFSTAIHRKWGKFRRKVYEHKRYIKTWGKSNTFLKTYGLRNHPDKIIQVDLLQISMEEYEKAIRSLDETDLMKELAFVCKLNFVEHVKVILNHVKDMKQLLNCLNSLYKKSRYTCSCLEEAFYNGSYDVVKLLLSKPKMDELILHKGKYGGTCLHLAILQNSPELVKASGSNFVQIFFN